MDTASPAPLVSCIPEQPEPDDAGQTTAEYALVLLGAAAIAAVLIKWATSSSGLTKLFVAVLRKLIQGVTG
ncbi:MAG TPA: DUF4244 domain-containing protein [Actinomycetota bacterium]|jgi:hypothetical protein